MTHRILIWFGLVALTVTTVAEAADRTVFVGTYTSAQSKGIYSFRFDSVTGKLTNVRLAVESSNPSFLAVHPSGRFLYAVNENDFSVPTVDAFTAATVPV